MEHIVQFAVGIDDAAIKRHVEERAAKQIIGEIKQAIANKLFESRYYATKANPEKDPLSDFSEGVILDFLEDKKDAIIQKAGELLADRLLRTKAAKSLIQNREG